MIIFEFMIDEQELMENLEVELDKADESFIPVTLFIMPVRLQINEKELFTSPRINKTDPWIGMPIVGVATEGLYRIRQIPTLRNVDYDLPEGIGTIEFILLENNQVKVLYKIHDIDEIVSYTELLEAFENFSLKVKQFLNERVPIMREHPYWGAWVRGEEE